MSRRTLSLVIAGLVLVLALWWVAFTPAPPVGAGVAEATIDVPAAIAVHEDATSGPADGNAAVARAKGKRTVDAAERERVLRGIRDALERRASGPREPAREATGERRAAPPGDAEGPGEGVRDRSDGELGDLVQAVNDDLLPLAEECYEEALAEHPDLRGMADLEISILGDEDLGGIVESLELGEGNEIDDPGFSECLRETLLSTIFPAPADGGQRDVRLTLRFEPPEG